MLPIEGDLIAAIATPPGIGGVGIIRISGNSIEILSKNLVSNYKKLQPNRAVYSKFLSKDRHIIDQGIAIFFKGPNSFTGEDVLEIQAHGGPVILNMLLSRVLELGARIAEPGEFSKRAFLAKKIDLIQAESIANLINAQTEQAAIAATNSLQGDFSKQINITLNKLTALRAHLEAIIDFPEDDVNELSKLHVLGELKELIALVEHILVASKSGEILTNGIKATIIGKPNVGKSSLLNYLSGQDKAIVTEIPGTTRDLISSKINLDGMIVEFIDTAGIRTTDDVIEQIGVKKAFEVLATSDLIILMIDSRDFLINENNLTIEKFLPPELDLNTIVNKKIILVVNKIDLIQQEPKLIQSNHLNIILVSIKQQQGITLLNQQIKQLFGLNLSNEQSLFMANARHIEALNRVLISLKQSANFFNENINYWDLLAEELKLAQEHLGKITGVFSNEDLLSKIFKEFCIGK